jgi:Tfp pilus assembly protein PilE
LEHGFGMIELLCSMTVMLIGIFAVFAVFQAGIVQLRRASTVTTAAAVGDSEMEKYRAIRNDSIGLASSDLAGTDATYRGDSAYKINTPTTTLSGAMTSTQLTMSVVSATGFPTSSPYIVQVDSELILISGGTGTTSWTILDSNGATPTIGRAYLGTAAAAHSSGATVTLIQQVNVTKCGSAPCTNSVPTKTVTGADGRSYRVDTYVSWKQIAGSGTTTGRLVKLVTVIVRSNSSPYRQWARLSSAFDLSTGV